MPIYTKPDQIDDPLHRLLLTAAPKNEFGNKTLNHLAEKLGVNAWSVRKWINAQRLPPNRAMEVVEISKIVGYDSKGEAILGDPRVTKAELDPFVYNF